MLPLLYDYSNNLLSLAEKMFISCMGRKEIEIEIRIQCVLQVERGDGTLPRIGLNLEGDILTQVIYAL